MVMKTMFHKEIARSVTHSLSRFFAILMIVALGTGFYVGLRSTSPDMETTVDAYADDSHMMDIHGISTLGFTENDVAAIRQTEGVENVMAGFTADVISRMEGKDQVIRIHSLPRDLSDENGDYLNRPVLVSGRMPEKSGECVVSNQKFFSEGDVLGTTIYLEDTEGDLADQLSQTEYTVVGVVDSAYYLSFSLGSSDLGSGSLDYFMYVPEEDFTQSVYTDLFLTVKDAAALSAFSDEYADLVEQTSDHLTDLAEERTPIRLQEIRDEAQEAIDDAQQEYDDAKAESDQKFAVAEQKLKDAEAEIAENEEKLDDAETTLSDGERAYQQGKKEYEDGVTQLKQQKEDTAKQFEEAQKQIDEARPGLEDSLSQLEEAQQKLTDQKPQIDEARELLDQLTAQHIELIDQLNAAEDAGDDALTAQLEAQIKALTDQIDPLGQTILTYDASQEQVTAQLQQVKDGITQLDGSQKDLDEGKKGAQKQFEEAEKKLSDAKTKLDKSRKDLDNGYADLETGRQQLADAKLEVKNGWDEYEEQKLEAEEKLADAKQKIEDGKAELDGLEEPTWYWLDRNTNVGFASLTNDADRIASLSTVFPIIFFLVAALVALTTMTRMVEEERTLIGTYRALGYSNVSIMSKYLIYAFSATLIGSVIGILICNFFIPIVCWNSYRIIYTAPDIITPFRPLYILAGCGASLLCTLGATFLSCFSTLRETPAALMQPKAPKAGKRILLEKIPAIWKRFNFIHKVTARNLFRYKKRLFMTIVGISGCTALLLTGFGIKDSVSDIVGLQYSKIFQYDTSVSLGSEEDLSGDTKALLENPDYFTHILSLHTQSVELKAGNKTQTVNLTVPKDSAAFSSFVSLQPRNSNQTIAFGANSAVITEKAAKLLGVSVGDTVSFQNSKDRYCDVTITGITENYIDHYLYLSPQIYEQVSGDKPEYTQIWAKSTAEDTQTENRLSDLLLAQDGVNTVNFISSLSDNFDTMISSLNYVIMVIVLFAGLLAFIVLYNLTNINITERLREIATIKVLGFYDREVSAYIYRETGFLTLLGGALGLIMGVVLHRFTIATVEVDMVMFGRQIAPMSFIWAILLTALFTVLVDLVMYRKLKKISMVESLKSIE